MKDRQSDPDSERQTQLSAEQLFAAYLQMFRNKSAAQIEWSAEYRRMAGEHKFWDKMPVPKPQTLAQRPAGPLLAPNADAVPAEPVRLPEGFAWCGFGLESEADLREIYTMLSENYVEDDDGHFRFDYSPEFLRWALTPPNYHPDLVFGIREVRTGRLIGFITALLLNIGIEGREVRVSEVNFLCVVKAFRRYSIASVLIREATRRSNLKGVWQGFYTSGTVLPTPFAEARYYHRTLDPRKLVAVGFAALPPTQTLGVYQQLNAVPEKLSFELKGECRPAELRHMKQAHRLLTDFLAGFAVHARFSLEEFRHFFLPRTGVIESFVVECGGRVTDFFSFYALGSSVLDPASPHRRLNACYAYYFAHTSMSVENLFELAVQRAKQLGYDVFNALDIMDYGKAFAALNFQPGDGFLKYYLFNWVLESKLILPNQIGAVLL